MLKMEASVSNLPAEVVVLREYHQSRQTARKIDVRLRYQIVEVAGHYDPDSASVVESRRSRGYHRAGLATLYSTVHETCNRPVGNMCRVDRPIAARAIGATNCR